MSDDKTEEQIGYRRPPTSTRFQRGQSGNPGGRPKNRCRAMPYDSVLGQMVTVREDGCERRMTMADAFLLQLARKGLAGDSAAAVAMLSELESARTKRPGGHSDGPSRITLVSFGIGVVLTALRLGTKKHPRDEKRVRVELQPWIVEAALARFGSRRLSQAEQQAIWENTSRPRDVRWPAWWTFYGPEH